MSRDIFPADDGAFRRVAVEFETVVKARKDLGGLSRGQLKKLREAIEEYGVEIERYREMSIALSDQARQREIKRVAMKRLLVEYMDAAEYDPSNKETRRKYAKVIDAPVEQPDTNTVTVTPTIRLESAPGRVLVYFAEVQDWAAGMCIYRRRVGESEYKMLKFAKSSPYEDEVPDSPAEYEYVARYWLRALQEVSKPCEPIRVTA